MKVMINLLIWFWIILGTFGICAAIFESLSPWLSQRPIDWLHVFFCLAVTLVSVIMYFMNKRRMALYVTDPADKKPKK